MQSGGWLVCEYVGHGSCVGSLVKGCPVYCATVGTKSKGGEIDTPPPLAN